MRILLAGIAVIVLTLGTWTAWGRFGYMVRSDPSAKLQRDALAGPGVRTVSLVQMTDFDWEQVVFFGPYTSPSAARKGLGFDWSGYDESGIRSTDLYSLIVFTDFKRVTRWWKLRRCAPDIDKAFLGVPVSRRDAILLLRNNDTCSFLLGPVGMHSSHALHPTVGSGVSHLPSVG